jgi:hypothetical protein
LSEKSFVEEQDTSELLLSKLKLFASRLTVQLKSGALIIQENSKSHMVRYPKSESVLGQLLELSTAVMNHEERVKKVQEIIGNEYLAEKIAREFP